MAEDNAQAPALDPVRFGRLLELMGPERLRGFADRYVAGLAEPVPRAPGPALERAAHRLVGQSGMLALDATAAAWRRVEEACRAGSDEGAVAHLLAEAENRTREGAEVLRRALGPAVRDEPDRE